MQEWVKRTWAQLITVSSQLFDHCLAVYRFLDGVVEYVKPNEAHIKIPIVHVYL